MKTILEELYNGYIFPAEDLTNSYRNDMLLTMLANVVN